jgi:hypothetical protein
VRALLPNASLALAFALLSAARPSRAEGPAAAPAAPGSAPAPAPALAPALALAPAPALALAPAPALAPASAPGADWVTLTLSSDDPGAAVYAKGPNKVGVGDVVTDSWSFVCLAPCGVRVDPRRPYRVMGESLIPSIEFNLAPGSGSVALDVHTRHPPSPAVTATLATLGGVSGLGGALMLLLDLAEHGAASALGSEPSSKKKLDGRADTYGDVGAGMLVGGVVLGTAAIIYLATGGKTELTPASPSKAAGGGGGGLRPIIPFGFAF